MSGNSGSINEDIANMSYNLQRDTYAMKISAERSLALIACQGVQSISLRTGLASQNDDLSLGFHQMGILPLLVVLMK